LEEIDADVTAHRQSAGPLGVGPPFAFVCFALQISIMKLTTPPPSPWSAGI